MAEIGRLILPRHLIRGLNFDRNRCNVFIHNKGVPDKDITLECSPTNIKTVGGCRTNYKHRGRKITGCPLRNTDSSYQALLQSLEDNFGFTLED